MSPWWSSSICLLNCFPEMLSFSAFVPSFLYIYLWEGSERGSWTPDYHGDPHVPPPTPVDGIGEANLGAKRRSVTTATILIPHPDPFS